MTERLRTPGKILASLASSSNVQKHHNGILHHTAAAAPGYNDPEGTHGLHSSKLANAIDPTVDSDRDHRGAPGSTGYTSSNSTTQNTTLLPASHTVTGTTNTTAHTGTENTGERVAKGIKGTFVQGSGISESLRGNINSTIDGLTGDTAKQAHDEDLAHGGFREVHNKVFEKRGTDKAL